MATININKFNDVFVEFVDSQIMVNAQTLTMKFLVGGGTFLVLRQSQNMLNQYMPVMKSLGIVNEHDQMDIEAVKGFLDSGFEKAEKIQFFGINFTKQDGEALLKIMEKYKDV